MSDVLRAVTAVIAETLGVSKADIRREARIMDDLGADSLDAVELLIAIEEEFSFEVTDEDAQAWITVGDIVDYAERRVGKAGAA